MLKQIAALLILLFCFLHANTYQDLAKQHAISYDLGGGRFGDKLLGYSQARYLSFLTKIPFLYRHFPYSDQLNIEFNALPYDQHSQLYATVFHVNSAETLEEFFKSIRDPRTSPTLFIIDYFPSDITEWEKDLTRSALLTIPWFDPDFFAFLKTSLTPKVPIPQLKKEGCLNVADHIRTLSGADTPDTSIFNFPLKHPDINYHKRQIKRVYEWNLKKPMHVFLFSDTKHPLELLANFRKSFQNTNITFDIQVHENVDLDFVVQDFFAMQQFDVLIATQSNFSMMASRLANFDMVIFPVHAIGQYPHWQIDRIQVITKKSAWFPYEVNTILKDRL